MEVREQVQSYVHSSFDVSHYLFVYLCRCCKLLMKTGIAQAKDKSGGVRAQGE